VKRAPVLIALALLGTAAGASSRDIPARPAVQGPCFSYWGANGRNWATVLIEETEIRADFSKVAVRLLQNARKEKDDWGCRNLGEVRGAPLNIIFDLLEAGRVTVIEDATGKPLSHVIALQDGPGRKTFHVRPGADAFLVRNQSKIASEEVDEQERRKPREKWSIEKMARSKANAAQIDFIQRFVGACRSEDKKSVGYILSRIQLPLETRFTHVDDDDSETKTDTVDRLQPDPKTGRLPLPLCIGDGGLQDVSLKIEPGLMTLELSFGSGPNETLLFRQYKGVWKLVAVEWIDH
jgi:hypothetical protein